MQCSYQASINLQGWLQLVLAAMHGRKVEPVQRALRFETDGTVAGLPV